MKLSRKRLYNRVFEFYTSLPIDYIDAYHSALIESRREQELSSYDTDFDRLAGLRRIEP